MTVADLATADMTAFLLLESALCECADREDGLCVCGWMDDADD